MLSLNLESQRIISACIDCQSSLSSGITNPWCQSTLRFKDSHLQESWNTSSEYRATTTLFSMNKEVQQFGRLPLQTHQEHVQRDQCLGNGDGKLYWCHCADLSTDSPYHQRNTADNVQWPANASTIIIYFERIYR